MRSAPLRYMVFFFVVVLVVLAGEAMVVPMELSTIQNLVTLDR